MIDAKTRRPPAITHPSCDSASRDGATGMDRRAFIAVMASVALTGCVSTQDPTRVVPIKPPEPKPVLPAMYRAMPNERFPIPAVDVSNLDRRLWRQVVHHDRTAVEQTQRAVPRRLRKCDGEPHPMCQIL